MAIICVDAGTSVIKAVAFDDRGRQLALARVPTEVQRPLPGHCEQDMDAVWNAVLQTIASVVNTVGGDVTALSITGQGDGCWLVDQTGRPTGPAVLWNDGRAADIVRQWQSDGILARAFARNGSLTFAGLPNAILTWLARHDPQRLARSHKSLYCDGWVFLNLTGRLAADVSDSSAPFLELESRRYSDELLHLFDMEWARRLLPDVLPDHQRTAPLTQAAAGQLGLKSGVPVVIAPYDIASMAIGVGAVSDGQVCSILGTTLCTEVIAAAPDLRGEPAGLTIAFAADQTVRAYPTLAGCEIIYWAQKLLGLSDPDDLSRLAEGIAPGAGGLCFLPYMSPAGERAPFFNPAARGSLLGLTLDHDRRHIARALIDGLTFVIRDCFEASKASPPDLRVCGGGANSSLWWQTIADVTGVPTIRTEDGEVGAKGAFIAALVATAVERDYVQAQSRVTIRDRFEPDPREAADTASYIGSSSRFAHKPLPPGRLSLRARTLRMGDAEHNPGQAWLGIDLGTQSVRALVVCRSGRVLGSGSQKFTSHREAGRHEQSPVEWWERTAAACREALRGIGAGSIGGLAVDGTSGTLLLTDPSGSPLTPGLMYDDIRATAEAAEASDAGAAVWQRLGYNRMQPAWALPKLLWLLRNQPELARRGRLAHQTDFINRQLIGSAVPADSSNALKSGYDLIDERWPVEVMDSLGVPEALLPPVVRSGTILGTVCPAAAEVTGIPADTPVIAGMTDGCAAQIGGGALSRGSWNSVLGTTLVLKGVTAQPISDPAGVVYSHRSPDGNWLPGGASSVGAGILSAQFPGRDLEELNAQAAEHEPAGAITYPLAGRGERFPFNAPQATGFTLGSPRDEIDRYASLLQGIAFIERLCIDYLDFLGADISGRLSLTGGGARSRYWCQLRADVLDRPVALPENSEAALGMAVLAAAEGRSLAQVAGEMVAIRETIDPRPDRVRRFREPYVFLVDELARRGWVPPELAGHAKDRAAK